MSVDNATDFGPNESTDASPSSGVVLLKLILSMNVRYHVDKTGEPCLLLPGDSLERASAIQSRRVRGYIAALAWKSVQTLPSAAELDRVLRVLEGLAWETSPRDATHEQLCHSIEDNPFLQVVIEFMRERNKHETQMQTLLNDLEGVARKRKFDMYAKQWPKTAAHLSAKLRHEQNLGILEQFGVAVEITRNRNGAKVVLSRVTPRIPGDDDEQVASPAASSDKPQQGNDLATGDGGDPEIRQQRLEDLILNRLNHQEQDLEAAP